MKTIIIIYRFVLLFCIKVFAAKLRNLLGKQSSPFFEVVWDPPHWANLAIEDVMVGKVGNSKAFMKRLIDRSAAIHNIFQRGKSLAEAKSKASQMTSKLKLTSRACATRFSTSQINEFKKLIFMSSCVHSNLHRHESTRFQFWIKEMGDMQSDFVADFCVVVDVFTSAVTYLVNLQGLQAPIWKAVVWFPKVIDGLDALSQLSISSPPESCVNP